MLGGLCNENDEAISKCEGLAYPLASTRTPRDPNAPWDRGAALVLRDRHAFNAGPARH
jgi:hypothetical protein